MATKTMHLIVEGNCSFTNEYWPAEIMRKPVPTPGGEKV